MSRGKCTTVEGVDDGKDYEETLEAMKAVTMKGKEIEAALKMVALTMHLMNVDFEARSEAGAEGSAVRGAGSSEASLDAAVALAGNAKRGDAATLRANLVHGLTHRTLNMAPGAKWRPTRCP